MRFFLGGQRLLARCVDGSSHQWLLEARDGQGVGTETAGAGAASGPVPAGLPGVRRAPAAALREPPACGDLVRRGAAAVADPPLRARGLPLLSCPVSAGGGERPGAAAAGVWP